MASTLWHEQQGLILPLALVALGVGVMVVTPFLIGMSTTLISARNSQASADEQYAAESAYEDARWGLTYGDLAEALSSPCDSTGYTLEETVNGVQPNVTVTRTGDCGSSEASDEALTSITHQVSVTAGGSWVLRDTATYFCAGMPATIMGTHEAETLTGTGDDDVIIGTGGDDNIGGHGGDDVICGGAGNDIVYGGSGNDQIYGGQGNDHINGELGDDAINGESGDDLLNGDAGDDSIDGGPGMDVCDGGTGDNSLVNCSE
jgi:Ca2+-binding RTX toxin-like protein